MHHISQREAAEIFELSPHTISSWQSGRRKASYSAVSAIAKWFELPVGLLAEDEPAQVVAAAAERERFEAVEAKLHAYRRGVTLKVVPQELGEQ